MARRFATLALLLVVAAAFHLQTNSHPSFDEFVRDNDRRYESHGEYLYRRGVYLTNLDLIDRQNAQETGTAVYAVNHLADLTDREIKQLMGLKIP